MVVDRASLDVKGSMNIYEYSADRGNQMKPTFLENEGHLFMGKAAAMKFWLLFVLAPLMSPETSHQAL